MSATAEQSAYISKVVIRFDDHVIKGYLDRGASGKDHLSTESTPGLPGLIRVIDLDSKDSTDVSLVGAKAVFFVRTFEGEEGHADLRFHDHLTPAKCLWVRVVFTDGETIEGMVENTQIHVLEPGFLMTPTDPNGNNLLIFILKSRIREFQVLGLREHSKDCQ